MTYNELIKLPAQHFKRYIGVNKDTFDKMIQICHQSYQVRHKKGGRHSSISVENKLLITLTYYREYRTQFHIAQDFGISESAVCKSIPWVEHALIKHPDFALPSKKALWQDPHIDTVLIDATEVAIERPKKSKNNATPVKRNDTP